MESERRGSDAPRRERLAMWVLGAVGLLLVGAAAGYLVAPPRATVVEEVVRPAAVTSSGVSEMPDVVGLEEAVARRVLADSGVSRGVELRSVPAAGAVGRVVSQSPDVGAPAEKVVITVSSSARMPALVGQDLDDAREELENLGAVVLTREIVAPDRPVRSILSTKPAAGTALPDVVVLEFASPGDAVNLAELDPVDQEGCGTDDGVSVGGDELDSSLVCEVEDSEPSSITYVLGRHAQLFQATLGLDDDAGTITASARLLVDGRPVRTWKLTYGRPVDVSIPVSRAMRLTLVVAPRPGGDDPPRVVFGSASLLGPAPELDQLR